MASAVFSVCLNVFRAVCLVACWSYFLSIVSLISWLLNLLVTDLIVVEHDVRADPDDRDGAQ